MFLPSPYLLPVYPSLLSCRHTRLCDNKVREALRQRLAVLIRRMLRERRRTTRLQESGLADIALDIHSLLVLFVHVHVSDHSAKPSPDLPDRATGPLAWLLRLSPRYEERDGVTRGRDGMWTSCGWTYDFLLRLCGGLGVFGCALALARCLGSLGRFLISFPRGGWGAACVLRFLHPYLRI